jgi:glyoxylase-like metal-dependent hydrolase (beta-lactamase superfamily II)
MQMDKVNQYFAEFVNPCTCSGMGDLFEFELLPKIKGLYTRDYAKQMDFGGGEDNEIDIVILTHAHVDHEASFSHCRKNTFISLKHYPTASRKSVAYLLGFFLSTF